MVYVKKLRSADYNVELRRKRACSSNSTRSASPNMPSEEIDGAGSTDFSVETVARMTGKRRGLTDARASQRFFYMGAGECRMMPLHSLRILDFSGLLPGPFATMMFADLGADVLRVESPTRPDLLRMTPPMDGEDSAAHRYLNRSKRSMALDLKKPESIEIVKRLIQDYDIVLEQFRPGVMERLGLGYETLREVNPRLIYCSLTGYGQSGPYRDRPGHDLNYVALSGIPSYSGRPGQGPPPLGTQLADLAGGALHAVIGVLAAVVHRQETGNGQHIDISMTDAVFSLNAMAAPAYLLAGVEPEPEQTVLNGGTVYDYYPTKDGRFFAVGSLEPPFLQLLCETIGRQDLFELGLSLEPESVQRLKSEVRKEFLGRTFDEWQRIFANVHACVEPVLTLAEAMAHPIIRDRGMIVAVPDGKGGIQQQVGCPIKFSSGEPEYRHVGLGLGANSGEVLQELGLSADEIAELREKSVFHG